MPRGGVRRGGLGCAEDKVFQTASDSHDAKWDDAIFDNKNSFEYNMGKLNELGTPIAKLKAKHNCARARKRDSNEENGLRSELSCCWSRGDANLHSNLWTGVGLRRQSCGFCVLPEAVVVQFRELDDDGILPFLPGVPRTVAIPVIKAEWKNPSGNSGVFIREQVPLMTRLKAREDA